MNGLVQVVTLVSGLGVLAAAVLQIMMLLRGNHHEDDDGLSSGDIRALRELAHDVERERDAPE